MEVTGLIWIYRDAICRLYVIRSMVIQKGSWQQANQQWSDVSPVPEYNAIVYQKTKCPAQWP